MGFQFDFVPFTPLGKILYSTFQWVFAASFISTIIVSEIQKAGTESAWISSLNVGAIMIGVIVVGFITLVLFFFMSLRE